MAKRHKKVQPETELVAPPKEEKVSKKRPTGRWLFVAGCTLVLLLGIGVTVFGFYYTTRILPHTRIGQISVGGLTKSAAAQKLNQAENDFNQQPVTFAHNDKTWQIKPADFSLTFDHAAALQEAYASGKQGTLSQQLLDWAKSLVLTHQLQTSVQPVGDAGKQLLEDKILASIENPPVETTLSFVPGNVTVLTGRTGQKLDYPTFMQQMLQVFAKQQNAVALKLTDFQPEVTVTMASDAQAAATQVLSTPWTLKANNQSYTLDPTAIASWLKTDVQRDSQKQATGLTLAVDTTKLQAYVKGLVGQVEFAALNVQLHGDASGISIVAPSKPGLKMDIEKTASTIQGALLGVPGNRTMTAVTQTLAADVREDNYAALGIKQLIGAATTDFSGSPNNRVFNIGVGQRSLNGLFIKDGDTFSTVGALGPIDESAGYLPELVIKDNRTVPEAGGGLCQVSTTMFRSVLNAGLPIVARTNHAYRVSYYERGVGPGLDATIYDPSPDFKWKNDTGHIVFMQSYIKGKTLTFELYGTSDGRVSTVNTPTILRVLPVGDPIYSNTDTLFVGEQKQIEHAHDGADVVATYSVSRGGQEIYKQTFTSHYKPWPAQYLVGTKPKPVDPTPSPTPDPAV